MTSDMAKRLLPGMVMIGLAAVLLYFPLSSYLGFQEGCMVHLTRALETHSVKEFRDEVHSVQEFCDLNGIFEGNTALTTMWTTDDDVGMWRERMDKSIDTLNDWKSRLSSDEDALSSAKMCFYRGGVVIPQLIYWHPHCYYNLFVVLASAFFVLFGIWYLGASSRGDASKS